MLIVEDVDRSVDFYVNKLGATELMRIPDGPAILGFANTWIIINIGGGPTEDKPTVHLAPPTDPDHINNFTQERAFTPPLAPPTTWEGYKEKKNGPLRGRSSG